MLRRVIISEAPRYAKGPPLSEAQLQKLGESGGSSGSKQDGAGSKDADKQGGASDEQQALRMGCAPYLQIFKAGELLHTAPASLGYAEKEKDPNELPFCQVADGTVSFHVNAMVQGDVLIRCRHLTRNRQRVSMFRAALHTGYVPPKVMRLTKSQLDGACADPRFADDFFVDLIFEPVDAEAAGAFLFR
jgi:tensin